MLKIVKDVTIRHDGKEAYCKAGQIVNVKATFDINDEVTRGIELRFAQKNRGAIQIASVASSTKAISLNPCNIHNATEQKIKETALKEDEPEATVDVEPEPEPEPTPPAPDPELKEEPAKFAKKKGRSGK